MADHLSPHYARHTTTVSPNAWRNELVNCNDLLFQMVFEVFIYLSKQENKLGVGHFEVVKFSEIHFGLLVLGAVVVGGFYAFFAQHTLERGVPDDLFGDLRWCEMK